MKINPHVQAIIDSIKDYDKKVKNSYEFLDKSWVLVDNENQTHKYIFRKNGELIMSVEGDVIIGKWEYITNDHSILIDRVKDKILLKFELLHDAVFILKKDSLEAQPFILVDPTKVEDLNYIKYLEGISERQIESIPYENWTMSVDNRKALEGRIVNYIFFGFVILLILLILTLSS